MSFLKKSLFLHNGTHHKISDGTTSSTNTSSVLSVPEGCVATDAFPFLPWDNEHNIVSKQVDNIVNAVFMGICFPLLFLVSFSTNVINMIVFYRHGLRERINACLFTLSLLDLLSICVAFSFGSDVLYMFVIGKGGELGPSAQFFIRHFLVGLHGLLMSSQMVYFVVALERCLCVTRPLLVKSFMSTKSTVIMLCTMVLVITGCRVFTGGAQYSVLCVFDPDHNSVYYMSYPSEFYFRHKYILDISYGTVNALLFSGVSFFGVLICTVITAVKLRKLTQWRQTVSSASDAVSSRDLAITRVIIGTSVLFLVCFVPAILMYVSFILIPELGLGGRYDNLAWVIRRFFQLSSGVNNTFNFFVYYSFGSKFRETTRQLFSSSMCCALERQSKKMELPASKTQ